MYNDVGPEHLDFSTLDLSAVPVIMKSDLSNNKAELIKEFSCILDSTNSPELNPLLDNFFRNGDLRINQIDRLLNFNIRLKNNLNHMRIIEESQDAVDAPTDKDSVQMQLADLVFSLYQQQETRIIRSLYELSKAYRFVSLWDFDIMGKYINTFGDQVMTTETGSLNGMFHLQNIFDTLDGERISFLDYMVSEAGPESHTFNSVWEYNKENHASMFQSLHETGQFIAHLKLDPAYLQCENCFNGRLISMYIELSGVPQNDEVPSTVVHFGDSSFLLPGKDGTEQRVVTLRQTPGDVAGGNVMTFDFKHLVESRIDPALDEIFAQGGNKFCENFDNPHDFFAGRPCKSPYATYTVIVPKGGHECSLNPDDWVSGSNCKGLDLTKFDTIRIYIKIKSWSNYLTRDQLILETSNQQEHQQCIAAEKCP
ncbi:uncharacterized protein LOC143448498 [Clavelina lepadiformis]|uniref:uncharacterized protein LOC143448498 n=1 Tax=Clavelina lepadiformis TaxID=159417 RepID=UPI004041289E